MMNDLVKRAVKAMSMKRRIFSRSYIIELEEIVKNLAVHDQKSIQYERDNKLAGLINSLPIPIMVVDYKHNCEIEIRFVNRQFEEITGYKKEDLNSSIEWDLVGRSKRISKNELISEWGNRSIEEKKKKSGKNKVDIRIKCKNGDYIYFEAMSSVLDDQNIFIFNDFSIRKKTEDLVKASSERLELALKGADLGLWDWDIPKGNITVNARILEMLGFNGNNTEVEYKAFRSFVHDDDLLFVDETLDTHFNDISDLFDLEFRLKTKNNRWKWVLSRGKLMEKSKKGKPLRMVGTLLDINSRRKVQTELLKAKEKAEQSDKLKSAFLANMSHEIRTPMNAIIGFAELLENEDVVLEKRRRYIEIIKKRSNDLLHIINDILDVSRIESGLMVIKQEEFKINELLDNMFVYYNQKAEDGTRDNIKLKLKRLEKEQDLILVSDESRIRQILTNLIDNAYKFTKEGSIEFGCRIVSKKMVFFVRDTGIGIPKEKQKVVFLRFTQHDTGSLKNHTGTGLGLSICKGLVELMEGEIWLDSDLGIGSTFYFSLPIKQFKGNEVRKEVLGKKQINTLWNNNKLLLIEDDRFSTEYLKEVLEPTGINLICANKGDEALNIFKETNDFDIILMDINLPDISGLEVTRQIVKINRNIPIIAQTAYAMVEDKDKAKLAGCCEFITKPIDATLLIEIIDKYINKEKQ